MQTYFFLSLAVAVISYLLAVFNIMRLFNRGELNTSIIYNHMYLGLIITVSSLFTVGFGIAWIVEYYNATH